MPAFLGTLTLGEEQDATIEEQGEVLLARYTNSDVNRTGTVPIAKHTVPEVEIPVKIHKRIETNMAIVLGNAAHGYVKPNILDVKLGVRLWADDARQEKKIRFEKVTAETTHRDLGFRIAGMRVWQGHGVVGEDIDEEGYKIYDKDYGRLCIRSDNIVDAFRDFIFSKSAGIDEELGKLVCQAFHADVAKIQEVLESQESRMYSASLLFVFEGDGVALRTAMEEASKPLRPVELVNGNGNTSDRDDEDEDEDEDEDIGPRIYSVKVIDFAHAQWVPGMGPDENSLVGVRSVANILKALGE
jgi:1D-myo-inositol-tetrakisphosphate 5-kinase/inositol-polyphosphate multikinase